MARQQYSILMARATHRRHKQTMGRECDIIIGSRLAVERSSCRLLLYRDIELV